MIVNPFKESFAQLTQSAFEALSLHMQRTVQEEILDQLPSTHLDAIASRRDLLKINYLMGNFRWIRSALDEDRADPGGPETRYLELGAGDGELAKRLLQASPESQYTALDLAPEPAWWPENAKWIRHDILSFDSFEGFTHLMANLFLHHFHPDELLELGRRIAASSIRRIIACEPCRKARHKHLLLAGKWIGFNAVTLNDGSVSVEAGFRGGELPELLGLDRSEWTWTTEETFMGAYRMLALRR